MRSFRLNVTYFGVLEEKPVKGLLERSPEVTGTRVRKQVERLNVTAPALESPARKNEIQPGKGVKLGTSPKIVAQLQVSFSHKVLTTLASEALVLR